MTRALLKNSLVKGVLKGAGAPAAVFAMPRAPEQLHESPEPSCESAPRLPGILQEIADAAGAKAALEVARVRGGTMAYFPARPGKSHWLTKAVGHEAALAIGRALASGLAGVELLVPLGPKASQAARWRLMRRMIAEGWSAAAIARAAGCHMRTAKRHRNGQVQTRDMLLAQADLGRQSWRT